MGQATGVGMFAMSTARLDLVEQFRLLIRRYGHEDLEFEMFPKNSLLEDYGLSLYAHRGTKPFRPMMIVESLRRSNPRLKGELEVLECKEFPLSHPVEKRRGSRVIILHADQKFLDALYEYCLLYTSPSPRD